MRNDLSTEERIDNYLLGRMTEAERAVFEQDMANDPDLREEYESQKELANAVQRAAMKDFLMDHSRKRAIRKVHDLRSFFSSGRRLTWAIASVAAILIAVVGVGNYTSTVGSLQRNGQTAFSQLDIPLVRGGNDGDALLADAYRQLERGEYDVAIVTIGQAMQKIKESLSAEVTSEETAYEHEVLQMQYYDLEWYEAIAYMRQGKVFKARRALASISSSQSPYAQMAGVILQESF